MGVKRLIPIANDNGQATAVAEDSDSLDRDRATVSRSKHDWTGYVSDEVLNEIQPPPIRPIGFAPPMPAHVNRSRDDLHPTEEKKWGRKGGGGGGHGGNGGQPPTGHHPATRRPVKRSSYRRTLYIAMTMMHLFALALGLAGMMLGSDPFYVAGFLGLASLVGFACLFLARERNLFLRQGLSISTALATLLWGMIALPMSGYLPNGLGPIFATIVLCLVGAVGRSLIMVMLGFSMLVMWAVATNAAGLPAQTSILSLMIGIFVVAAGAMTIRSSLISLAVMLFSALAASAILWTTGYEPYAIAGLSGLGLAAVYHGYASVQSAYATQMRDISGLLLIMTLFVFQALAEPGVDLERGWAVRGHDMLIIQALLVVQALTFLFNLYRLRVRRLSFLGVVLIQLMMGLGFVALLFPQYLLPSQITQIIPGTSSLTTSTLVIALAASAGFAMTTTLFIRAWRTDSPLLTGLVALLFISQGVILGRWLSPYPYELVIAAGTATLSILMAIYLSYKENLDGTNPAIYAKTPRTEGFDRSHRLSYGVDDQGYHPA